VEINYVFTICSFAPLLTATARSWIDIRIY